MSARSSPPHLPAHLPAVLLVAWWCACACAGYSCPYGAPCSLEPAPPGRAPPCAQPGLTYCLHPDPYPEKIIRSLISLGQYDYGTLLSDESREEFSAASPPDHPYQYGPNSLPGVEHISLAHDTLYHNKAYNTKFHTRYNHDIFSGKTPLQPPSPLDPSPYNINYHSANFSKFGFQGYSAPGYLAPGHTAPGYSAPGYSAPGYSAPGYSAPGLQGQWTDDYDKKTYLGGGSPYPRGYRGGEGGWQAPVTRYNPSEWWKYVSPSRADVTVERSVSLPAHSPARRRRRRNAALVAAAGERTLSGAEALRIAIGLASEESRAERARRQAGEGAGAQALCSARTEYITPRAALNNRGSWKYVVNMPDNMTQLVRAEVCTSTTCSGLCTVPPGYTSKCEQKYIQKRLVALQANGQNLYTDVFWIPSCCQCTIIPSN